MNSQNDWNQNMIATNRNHGFKNKLTMQAKNNHINKK